MRTEWRVAAAARKATAMAAAVEEEDAAPEENLFCILFLSDLYYYQRNRLLLAFRSLVKENNQVKSGDYSISRLLCTLINYCRHKNLN